jgi:hypothetical protein
MPATNKEKWYNGKFLIFAGETLPTSFVKIG